MQRPRCGRSLLPTLKGHAQAKPGGWWCTHGRVPWGERPRLQPLPDRLLHAAALLHACTCNCTSLSTLAALRDNTQGQNVQLPTALYKMLHAAARHGLVMCVHNGRRVPAPAQAAAGEAPAARESSRADAAPTGPAASGSSAAAHSEASEAAGEPHLGGAEAAEAGSSLAAAG